MAKKKISVIQVYGSGILTRSLEAILIEIPGVRDGGDIENIHRMRVATRRLRAGLATFEKWMPGKRVIDWVRQVRSITRSLGAARDTDVQLDLLRQVYQEIPQGLEKAGVHRLLVRIQQRRKGLQADVLKSLAKYEKSGVSQEMQQILGPIAALRAVINMDSPVLYGLAQQSVGDALDKFLSFEPYIHDPDEVEKLHAMRIAAKHLRYTLEIFAELYEEGMKPHLQTMRRVQDLLGDIHDDDVWIAWLPEFIKEERQRTYEYYGIFGPFRKLSPGLDYFLNRCQQDRNKTYGKFLREWDAWNGENAWQSLRDAVRIPERLIPSASIDPELDIPAETGAEAG